MMRVAPDHVQMHSPYSLQFLTSRVCQYPRVRLIC